MQEVGFHRQRAYTLVVKEPTPKYPFWTSTTLAIGRALFTGETRFASHDARAMLSQLDPPLVQVGAFSKPNPSGVAIAVNHYTRPGFNAWWIALVISALYPKEVHWTMTEAWVYPEGWKSRWITPASRWVLNRLARMYSFTPMPPMPPRPQDAVSRAQAVRYVLRYVKQTPCPVLGIAPEGSDSPDGRLTMPPHGTGRFFQLLSRQGLMLQPVGLYEQNGRLTIHIGEMKPMPNAKGNPEAREHSMADYVMQAIAGCLPTNLRGPYQEDVDASRDNP